MGIRYYAYPVPAEHAEAAAADPKNFMSTYPLADAWGLVPTGGNTWVMDAVPRPEMLYLDKCWALLQRLARQSSGRARTCYALFEGDVTETGMGWMPWYRALNPEEVAEIAVDIAQLGEQDVDALLGRPDDRGAEVGDHAYLLSYLQEAQAFTRRLADQGSGLVYMIG